MSLKKNLKFMKLCFMQLISGASKNETLNAIDNKYYRAKVPPNNINKEV